jgi:purine-cytosine permease-like protein
MLFAVLRWMLALIIGTAATVVIVFGGAFLTAVGAVLGFVSLGSMIILFVALLIDDWWTSRKE